MVSPLQTSRKTSALSPGFYHDEDRTFMDWLFFLEMPASAARRRGARQTRRGGIEGEEGGSTRPPG
jgi:hypothetical protein